MVIETIAGIIVAIVFLGFSLYRTTLSMMPLVNWLFDLPKYWRGNRTITPHPRVS